MDPQTEEKKAVKDASGRMKGLPGEKNTLNLDDLDKDWYKLQEEWKRLDEKQKQYLQNLSAPENVNRLQDSGESQLPVQDIENKLAEYETKTRELESMQETWKKPAAPPYSSDNTETLEDLKKKEEALITTIPEETISIPPAPQVSEGTQGQKTEEALIPQAQLTEVKTPEGGEVMDAFPTPPEALPVKLKKKPGIMDKMHLLKYPVSVMVIEKIDGKKTKDQIIQELKITPEEANKAMEILKKGGYV